MMCKLCPFKTSSKEVMEKHVLDRHSPEEEITTKQTTKTGRKRKSTVEVDAGGKRKQVPSRGYRIEVSYKGICKIEDCGMECNNLMEHFKELHSGRSRQCPFCTQKLEWLSTVTNHLSSLHPYKIGILPGRSGKPLNLDEVMSGNNLMEMMQGYGQDVEGAVAYQFFAVSYDPANLCHRWVAFEVTQALLEASEKEGDPPSKYTSCPRVIGEQPNSFTIRAVGCDHGHAAPKYLYRAYPTAFQETCLFPNISAQTTGFNHSGSSMWERNEQRLAKHNDRVIVVTGPTYNSNDEIGWVSVGSGYKHRIPEGFFRFVIIRNRGQPDVYQAFYYPNEGNNERLFIERYSIEELQEKIGPRWELLPLLRTLTYTWQNEK